MHIDLALSPVARPPARYPETRAGDFSRARAGIDQKIPACRTGPPDLSGPSRPVCPNSWRACSAAGAPSPRAEAGS
jgi:hypothetical protein